MDWDPLVNPIKNNKIPIISSISLPIDPVANYLSGEVAAASICRIIPRRAR
jgi:hypothetical protein